MAEQAQQKQKQGEPIIRVAVAAREIGLADARPLLRHPAVRPHVRRGKNGIHVLPARLWKKRLRDRVLAEPRRIGRPPKAAGREANR